MNECQHSVTFLYDATVQIILQPGNSLRRCICLNWKEIISNVNYNIKHIIML